MIMGKDEGIAINRLENVTANLGGEERFAMCQLL